MGRQLSIKDVALRAGTSIATVSRILNNVNYPVSDRLRKQVETAIRDLGYRPNRIAQNLRSGQTRSIGLIVRDISESYFSAITKGVSREASARGLMPLVCSSMRVPQLELEYMRHLAQYQVAGIVLAGAGWVDDDFHTRMEAVVNDMRDQNVRVVGCAPQGVAVPCAQVDNREIGRRAFGVLHALGHTHFAVLDGDAVNVSNRLRVAGFVGEAAKHGAVWKEAAGSFTWEHGYSALAALLAADPEITAVYATNDRIAVGALRYLQETGRRVPEEVSILGTGGIAVTPYTSPALSTFRLPFEEIGAAAVRMLFEPDLADDAVMPFSCEYVHRESVGPRMRCL